MVSEDIPLNQGCLKPIDIRIPAHTLLCPGPGAAVVGGNVLTSQRVTDVVLKAFLAASASQVLNWPWLAVCMQVSKHLQLSWNVSGCDRDVPAACQGP